MKSAEPARSAPLETYRAKRDFGRTREPIGSARTPAEAPAGGLYVIQKHRARRLHFDFRLELDGVLKSWAVTRGPSLDPAEKRLAVRVEDHPLEYGSFEGTIPKGEYGGGEVMLWDRGTWTPKGDPHEGLEKGQLKFELHGERLKGGFSLVRPRSREKEKRENWLLVKERDECADRSSDPIRKWTKSVATGRTFEEITAGDDVWSSKKGRSDAVPQPPRPKQRRPAQTLPMPRFRPPQLAVLSTTPPSGPEWLHEIKFDGYRVLAAMAGGSAKLYTRSGLDWTEKFRGVAEAVAQLPARGALIDGEVVVPDENGRTDFGRLQRALDGGGETLRYYAFDLLELDGEDLAGLPLIERKRRLAALLSDAPDVILYSDHIIGDGREILEQTCRMGLEGIVSKRADKSYVSRRAPGWIKSKCSGRDEFVIGGWRPSTKKERPFSSLLLGEFEDGKLRYRGRVGTGFDEARLAEIARKLRPLARKTSPFADAPREAARDAKWVEPRLVAEIAYAERTADGYLRHPSFIGLREDKPASQVKAPEAMKNDAAPKREDPATSSPATRLTHPDKLLFPGAGVTKAELAAYWRKSRAARLASYSRASPFAGALPRGERAGLFFPTSPYARHAAGAPTGAAPRQRGTARGVPEDRRRRRSRGRRPDRGARIAYLGLAGLDGGNARSTGVRSRSRSFRALCGGQAGRPRFSRPARGGGLETFPLLTGGKGIHVVAPLVPRLSWSELKSFARGVAMRLATDDPQRFTAKMTKVRRKGKVYIDYLRNERGASAIAPYSPRARETPSVATPVSWTELSRIERADAYAMDMIPRRLGSLRGDPWAGYFDLRQEISPAALRMFP